MSYEAFQKHFGNNPEIPTTHDEILRLARTLYQPLEDKFAAAREEPTVLDEEDPGCREYELGLLFAALQNPDVSDLTRDAVDNIIDVSIPALPKTYTSGHFRILYTTSDANTAHNITTSEAQSVAYYLNQYWNKYYSNFTKPLSYWDAARRTWMIDVKIYYISSSILGQTGSGWNHIELNSSLCVKNLCKRKTTSAHELFHRVQYAYGYVSGTANLKWIVEGTAAYSQKYTNMAVRDYMARMNSGLSVPDKPLITGSSARSYDACHLWVYLDEAATTSTYPMGRAIRDVWATYKTNGKNAKAAVYTVAKARLGSSSFDNYVIRWIRANYCKDFANASASWKHDYTEDETSVTQCSVTYGPLSHVPRTYRTISSNTTVVTLSGSVNEYGADYYEFTIGPAVTNLKIRLDGAATGDFAWEFLPMKAGKVLTYSYVPSGMDYTYQKTLTAGQWDKFGLVVLGRSKGGSYTVRVGP